MRPVISLLLSVQLAFGAIAHDADSNSGAQTTSTSYSWNHTVTGSNTALAVGVDIRGTSCTVSGITYNSVALSLVTGATATNGTRRSESWFLVAPTTGTNSIAVTLTGCTPSASAGVAVSFTGVAQTSSTEAGNGATGSASTGPAQVTITSVTDNTFMFVNAISGGTTTSLSALSGQTLSADVALAGTFRGGGGYITAAVTPAGAKTMGFTLNGVSSDNWSATGFALNPAVAATGTSSRAWIME